MSDPILARFTYREHGRTYDATVHGGLHYIRGNSAPHFSLTADVRENGRDYMGGCCHDLILAHKPEFADLAALHLSDIDGRPMHALENARYWLVGAVPAVFPNYPHHGGNETPARTGAECLAVLAKHLRCDPSTAEALARECNTSRSFRPLQAYVDAQAGRWKAEAGACIARHSLVVYGDPWAKPTE